METAQALSDYATGPLLLDAVTAIDSPDSVAIPEALAGPNFWIRPLSMTSRTNSG